MSVLENRVRLSGLVLMLSGLAGYYCAGSRRAIGLYFRTCGYFESPWCSLADQTNAAYE